MTDATLARARAGDSDAFGELTDPYRRELHVHSSDRSKTPRTFSRRLCCRHGKYLIASMAER
jgi:hypothetical protein